MPEGIIEINDSFFVIMCFVWIGISLALGHFVAKSSSSEKNELDKLLDNKILIYSFFPFVILFAFFLYWIEPGAVVRWLSAFAFLFIFCFSLGYSIERSKKL